MQRAWATNVGLSSWFHLSVSTSVAIRITCVLFAALKVYFSLSYMSVSFLWFTSCSHSRIYTYIIMQEVHLYVGCKAWICAIHGLLCTKRGSALCTTIHGLSAQSADCAIHCAQSTDLTLIVKAFDFIVAASLMPTVDLHSCHYR